MSSIKKVTGPLEKGRLSACRSSLRKATLGDPDIMAYGCTINLKCARLDFPSTSTHWGCFIESSSPLQYHGELARARTNWLHAASSNSARLTRLITLESELAQPAGLRYMWMEREDHIGKCLRRSLEPRASTSSPVSRHRPSRLASATIMT